jgi:hypothetical protein
LSIEETKAYYDLDTFREDIAATQKAEEQNIEEPAEGDQDIEMQESVEVNGEEQEDVEPTSADDVEQSEESEQPEAKLSAKDRKKKERLEKAKEKRKAAKLAAKERKQTEQTSAEQEDDDEVKSNRPSVTEVDQGMYRRIELNRV